MTFQVAASLNAMNNLEVFCAQIDDWWPWFLFYPLKRSAVVEGTYVPWSKVAILGMVIPPLIGILIMGI